MNECNLSIDREFIQLQNMLSNMDQRQREKFTEDTCGMPHSIFSIVNLYPFLNELRKSPALIGKLSILMSKLLLEFALNLKRKPSHPNVNKSFYICRTKATTICSWFILYVVKHRFRYVSCQNRHFNHNNNCYSFVSQFYEYL